MGLPIPRKKTFPREDYLELIELTLTYLGGKLPAERIFKIHKPMAKKFLIGKPTFLTLSSSTLINFLIGPRTWVLFDLLGLVNDQKWPQINPQE